MLLKHITYAGTPCVLACDGHCDKAWGISNRPRVELSGNPDDYAFLSDGELGQAPDYPGTSEGGHFKPTSPDERLNKWCCRECERSILTSRCRDTGVVQLKDFSRRLYNIPGHDPEAAK